ncbi:MAG TPA: hypothetical protein DIC51_02460 [Coxiellaceae bacterium]|nr:hypothetical protein [Coxiellaceae bacterium]
MLFEPLYKETDWSAVRKIVATTNPPLAKIIDAISPNKSFKLFQVRYPYGSIIADKGQLFFPSHELQGKKPAHIEIPANIKKYLKRREFPLSLLTKNSAEIFKIMPDRNISRFLIKPGGFFGLWENLDPAHNEYVRWMWSLSSGARSIYLLPKISNAKGHKVLRKKYGLSSHAPRDWAAHWDIFVELANSSAFEEKWYNEFIFFSDKWLDTAIKDPAWKDFLGYLRDQAWNESNYWRNKTTFDLEWEDFLHHAIDRNIKFNLHISLIVKQLVLTGIGVVPGFCIANQDSSFAPLNALAKLYTEDYKIEYAPLFMAPSLFSFDDPSSIYYSLQYPNLLEAVPSYNNLPEGILSAMPEIIELLDIFRTKFASKSIVEGSLTHVFCSQVDLCYFHSLEKKLYNIFSTEKIPDCDFSLSNLIKTNYPKLKFPSSSTFLKGCILFRKRSP